MSIQAEERIRSFLTEWRTEENPVEPPTHDRSRSVELMLIVIVMLIWCGPEHLAAYKQGLVGIWAALTCLLCLPASSMPAKVPVAIVSGILGWWGFHTML